MIKIKYQAASLTGDEELKQQAATKQMKDLLDLLGNGAPYATLSSSDRHMLLNKGYAADLVDNLVFFTERIGDDVKRKNDSLVVGFTHSAFDPSIYACDSITNSLKQTHAGKCAYCESVIEHTSQGCVSHFRPAWGCESGGKWDRQAYYQLAYQQENLLLSCHTCHERYKGNHFPVVGARASTVGIKQEQALLVNPYLEDPRNHIRFNALTGEAYAYDELKLYCENVLGINKDEIEDKIWQQPELVPSAAKKQPSEHDKKFYRWRELNLRRGADFKGSISIDVLGLNRPELILARIRHLRGLFGIYSASQLSTSELSHMQAYCEQLKFDSPSQEPYNSMSIDAVNTWQRSEQSDDWFGIYQATVSTQFENKVSFKPSLTSSLHYMVLETELSLENKRRIVCLHSSDYLYGDDRKVKTVFLPIDWENDSGNVIKVLSDKVLWEASFSELAETQPLALHSLFASNELWVEGQYSALA